MEKLKGAIKSKTIGFSSLLVVFGLLETNLHFAQNFLSPDDFGLAVAVIGGITGVLRALTNRGLGE